MQNLIQKIKQVICPKEYFLNRREFSGPSSQVTESLTVLIAQFLKQCSILNYYWTLVMKKCQLESSKKHTKAHTIHNTHTQLTGIIGIGPKRETREIITSGAGEPAFHSISWQVAWRGGDSAMPVIHTEVFPPSVISQCDYLVVLSLT